MLGVGAEMRALARTRPLTSMPEDLRQMLQYSPKDVQNKLNNIAKSANRKGIKDVSWPVGATSRVPLAGEQGKANPINSLDMSTVPTGRLE